MATAQQSEVVYTRPRLYPAQEAAIFCDARYGIVEASTKAGKTTACMAWLLEEALRTGKAGRQYWWVAPILDQAKIAYRRMKRSIPHTLYTANETERTLTLPTGAVLAFKGSDHPDSLYGDDVYAAVVDEASRCKVDAWHAVRSTLTATRGPMRIIGNVHGTANWAYQLARRAQAGAPDMHYARLTARDAIEGGILTEDEVADARRLLPEDVFNELYMAVPSADGGNPFGADAIERQVAPLSVAPPVVWGWDLAKSVDWCVGIALDADGTVCHVERWNKTHLPPGFSAETEYWEATIARIRDLIGDLPALIDSTGVGDPVVEAITKGKPKASGLRFTTASKQQLMEGLAVAIQQARLRFPQGVVADELRAFEYEITRTGVRYSAPSGNHDDCVCALALAVKGQGAHTRAPIPLRAPRPLLRRGSTSPYVPASYA